MGKPIHTLGHSNRSLAEFLDLLGAAGIEAVHDVRRFPHSRVHPHFDGARLREALSGVDIDYLHSEALGGRRTPLPATRSPNRLWREGGFRGFADYALGAEFRRGLGGLLAQSARQRIAIVCSEAVWWRCHRRIIADYLLLAGAEVVHILNATRREPARMTPGAEPQPDGAIHYPETKAPPGETGGE